MLGHLDRPGDDVEDLTTHAPAVLDHVLEPGAAAPAGLGSMLNGSVRVINAAHRVAPPAPLPARLALRLRTLRRPLARSARAIASSVEGGIDEFVEFFPNLDSNSATRTRRRSLSANANSRRASSSAIRVSTSTPTVYTGARAPWRTPTHRAIPARIRPPLNSYVPEASAGILPNAGRSDLRDGSKSADGSG